MKSRIFPHKLGWSLIFNHRLPLFPCSIRCNRTCLAFTFSHV